MKVDFFQGGVLLVVEGILEQSSGALDEAIDFLFFDVTFTRMAPESTVVDDCFIKPPTNVYRAKKRILQVTYDSRHPRFAEGVRPDHALFVFLFEEALKVLQDGASDIARKTKIDRERLTEWLSAARAAAPLDQAALNAMLAERVRRIEERPVPALSWETLDVEWDDYDRRARAILDDVFYWDQGDCDAPHGNDKGADLLADVQEGADDASASPEEFVRQAMASYGGEEQLKTALAKPTTSWDDEDEQHVVAFDQLAIALPFALLKVRGEAPPAAIALGMAAIARERTLLERGGRGARPERAAALARMEAKLTQL